MLEAAIYIDGQGNKDATFSAPFLGASGVVAGTPRFFSEERLLEVGLDFARLKSVIDNVAEASLKFNSLLINYGGGSFAECGELATFSAIMGICVANAVASNSNGLLIKNRPHKFPDILNADDIARGIEIKLALESNNPKGHLPKSGCYLTVRYVLAAENGVYTYGLRGTRAIVWEIRCGRLDLNSFSLSNTDGDSGKTATIGADALMGLDIVYLDLANAPYSQRSRVRNTLALYEGKLLAGG